MPRPFAWGFARRLRSSFCFALDQLHGRGVELARSQVRSLRNQNGEPLSSRACECQANIFCQATQPTTTGELHPSTHSPSKCEAQSGSVFSFLTTVLRRCFFVCLGRCFNVLYFFLCCRRTCAGFELPEACDVLVSRRKS